MASGGMNTPGTDVLRTQFTDEEMTFLTGEAHRHGLVVTAHAHGLPAVEQALAAGVDGLEHGSCLTENGVQVTDEVLAALVERQIPVGGALAAPPAAALARAPAALRARIERAGLTPGDVQADPAADSPRSASGGSAVRCRPGLGDLTLPCPRLPA
jgi:imidazolonepropionase-like amidohydrolase